jgi:hypothetical protein
MNIVMNQVSLCDRKVILYFIYQYPCLIWKENRLWHLFFLFMYNRVYLVLFTHGNLLVSQLLQLLQFTNNLEIIYLLSYQTFAMLLSFLCDDVCADDSMCDSSENCCSFYNCRQMIFFIASFFLSSLHGAMDGLLPERTWNSV